MPLELPPGSMTPIFLALEGLRMDRWRLASTGAEDRVPPEQHDKPSGLGSQGST